MIMISVGIMIVVVLSAACAFLSVVVDLEMLNDTKDKSLMSADDARKLMHGNDKQILKELKKINKKISNCAVNGSTCYINYFDNLSSKTIDELKKKGYKVQTVEEPCGGGYKISWKRNSEI